MSDTYSLLLSSIAKTVEDYRKGEIPAPVPEHIELWVRQFPERVRIPLLRELDHVLRYTYFSRDRVISFLQHFIADTRLFGPAPCKYISLASFLGIQKLGRSQRDMLDLLDELVKGTCGSPINRSDTEGNVFVYLDDGIFSGNHLLNDLTWWITTGAPAKAIVLVASIAVHSLAKWYVEGEVTARAARCGKEVHLRWWHAVEFENRKAYRASSDVLWPVSIPDDSAVVAYVSTLEHLPSLRIPGSPSKAGLYTCEEGRHLLEQEFLKAGVGIRTASPDLTRYQRPLGNMVLESLGFGSLFITFRNCPNNCPLALWAGNPWYPLFPRITNTESRADRFLADHGGEQTHVVG